MYQKSKSILWALTDSGIVIQNLNSNTFYELDQFQEKVWSLIDGTHDEAKIISTLATDNSNPATTQLTERIIAELEALKQAQLIIKIGQ